MVIGSLLLAAQQGRIFIKYVGCWAPNTAQETCNHLITSQVWEGWGVAIVFSRASHLVSLSTLSGNSLLQV